MNQSQAPQRGKNRYQNLMMNTILFAVSTFAPKLITFVMNAIISRNLSQVEYGDYTQVQVFCNLILPIIYITISEAVIRFGSDELTPKSDVYTTAIAVLTFGYSIFVVLNPALQSIDTMARFSHLVYPYVLASALRTINGHFVRALGNARLFAIDGILTTLITTILSVVFLIPLDMGAMSTILATIVADALSALFLFFMSRSWRYFKPGKLDLSVMRSMISYSLLMVPTSVFWWVINASNRSIIREYHGQAAAGLYGNATTIPQLITLVSQVFIQAWQMSAFSEQEGKEREDFFARIFKSYYTLLFLAISGLILIVRPFMKLYVGPTFYEAWEYIPFLVLGIGISCLVTFLGTVYNAHKRNLMITLTTGAGALVNYLLNRLLIPDMGPQGASIATMLAYLIVFIIRLVDTQRFMDLQIEPVRLLAGFLLLVGQCLISLTQPPLGILWQVLIFLALILLNLRHILFLFSQLGEMVKGFTSRWKPQAPSGRSR